MLRRRTSLAAVLAGMLAISSCTSSSSSASGGPSATGSVPSTSSQSGSAPAPSGSPSSSGSGSGSGSPTGSPSGSASATSSVSPSASASAEPSETPIVPAGDTKAVAKQVQADELGQVPVLMYHQIIDDPGKNRYDETPAAFRAELERLLKDGYVPVNGDDYVAGRIDIPAGKHPVVLTFDDATVSQFKLADGKAEAGTAVAIMQEFAAAHPEFPAKATFFVNTAPPAFTGGAEALKWLHDNGFEVAVHTVSHANLGQLNDEQVQKEMALNFAAIRDAIGEAPTTFALPFGVHPKNAALTTKGSYKGESYDLAGVFLVGSNPAASPFAKRFDAANIPRIRSQHIAGADAPYESKSELDVLAKNPERLFTSDGDPATLSYPKASAQYLGRVPDGMTKNAY